MTEDPVSRGEAAARQAIEMLTIALGFFHDEPGAQAAYTAAGFDFADPARRVGYASARLAAVLLNSFYTHALGQGAHTIAPGALVTEPGYVVHEPGALLAWYAQTIAQGRQP